MGTFDKENTCVSPTDIPLGNVHVDASHEYCYYPSNHDGTGFYDYAYDEDDDSGSDDKGGSGSGSGSRLTNTGDPLTGVGPLAIALAAAGAGLAAYSARRTRLENGGIDESEDEE